MCVLCVCVFASFPFGFESVMWDLIEIIPDLCLLFTFKINKFFYLASNDFFTNLDLPFQYRLSFHFSNLQMATNKYMYKLKNDLSFFFTSKCRPVNIA